VLAELRLTLTGNPNFKMVKALILETIKEQQGIIGEKVPQVLIEEITNSELSILIQFWISDINQADEIQSEIKTRIYSAMQKHELQLRVRPVA
jgi:small-conductance mechanosensitive channel